MQTCCISIPYQIRLVFTCGRPIAPFSFLPAWYHNQIDGWLPAEVLFCLSPTLSLQDICSKHKRIDVSVVERDFIWKSPVDGLLELQNSTLNNKNTWLKEMEMIHLGNLSSFKPLEKKRKVRARNWRMIYIRKPWNYFCLMLFTLRTAIFMRLIAFDQGKASRGGRGYATKPSFFFQRHL